MAEKVNEINQFGNKLSVCRQNKNMTQEELAGRLGITPQALSKWERGVSLPDIAMLPEISMVLEVSGDWLLGIETSKRTEGTGEALQDTITNGLRKSLEPLELIFGAEIISVFVAGDYAGKIEDLRRKLSNQGILMPVVRIRDEMLLEGKEFMILAYHNVLYSETLEQLNEDTLNYMVEKLEQCVLKKYYEIISPDIVKSLVDNLRMKYPALIEGIVPEKISFGLLTEIVKLHLKRGNSALYLPKIIEIAEYQLERKPDLSAEMLEEIIARKLCREDNFWIVMRNRQKKE